MDAVFLGLILPLTTACTGFSCRVFRGKTVELGHA
ncbi:hypothetical protein CI1B_48020 [Bradyrhizobium ivorense]|uniref:Uncharacterized protein n=1 Tax=Bradyrhizobium ivorense TaxID=2511166 RepID=A0A508TGE0_9BRAD|nr:hypothetical protein CI1B_48020 [Bradyrhizobium ivorense]